VSAFVRSKPPLDLKVGPMTVAVPPPTIPSPTMPAHRRGVVHGMKVMPSLGELSWRIANKVALTFGGRQRIAPTYAGGRMLVDLTDFIGTRIYHFGVWEPHLSALISARLKSGDVFCDVGANIGYYTVLAAPIVGDSGKVVAIEPSPATFEALCQNVKLNNADNVRVVSAAVSDRPGTLTLFHSPYTNRGATTTVARGGFIREVDVPALPLADILLPDEKQRLRLIKIDVEGAEGPIMQNLLETIRDYPETMEIICEMSVSETIADAPDIDMLVERFAAAGFRAFAIPNAYDISAYLSFKSPQAPAAIVSPLSMQQDILFSRQFSIL
jgi:FkbM family methyltransferase